MISGLVATKDSIFLYSTYSWGATISNTTEALLDNHDLSTMAIL
ncbi:Uncharacterised protein [Legionella feeleii]|uniref:Uncharacterized protein n=1 Tax=Legionella feeleii TaxID=453 RepID=A0A378IWC7_9GAMM|nr:Uncharacterised protein [Legionella feeleii]